MSIAPLDRWTEQAYLAMEKTSGVKHEFANGELIAMTGASIAHNMIVSNVHASLYNQLKGGPCRPYGSDMRLKVEQSGIFAYPDVMVICGPPEVSGDKPDTVTNPQVLVEVLSPSTEAYDRGEKFGYYRRIPSLKQYLLISQARHKLELHTLQNHFWVLSETDDMCQSLMIDSLDVSLDLAVVYDGVPDS